MTKIVTATAVMRLVEGGKLDLNAPADEYFPRRAYKRF
jgi:CubicO group peptidase (beta-lactamase class C family)